MADLSVEFCGVTFKNPIVLASGILGVTGDSMAQVVKNGAGGVTSKSLWPFEHKGHPNPVVISTEEWMLNAVGIPDAGPEKAREEIARYREATDAPFIANIVGGVMEDYAVIAAEVATMDPDIVEVNISCPNVEAGADGVTAINTVGPGMAIDIDARAPILANKVGGLSGPAIKPLAVKHVFDIYKATGTQIIGTGGVCTGRDAIEMMMAGATLVGVGSAVFFKGQEVFGKIVKEMNEWCDKNGVKKLSDLIGAVHEN